MHRRELAALDLAAELALLEDARSIVGVGPLTVVVASYPYKLLLDNWLRHIRALRIERVLIVAMDEPLERALADCEFRVGRGAFNGTESDFWYQRLLIWDLLVQNGIDLIQSDVDAIWIRNPIDFLIQYPTIDFFCSEGTFHPGQVQEVWGFVLCTGFFLLRSNSASKSLLDALLRDPARILGTDDQDALNHVLLDAGVCWKTDGGEKYQRYLGDYPYDCYRDIHSGYCASLRLNVGLLPHHLFPRLPESASGAYVKHFLRPEDDAARISQLRDLGCWISPSE